MLSLNKKILLLTLEYPPFKGGVSRYYENLLSFWGEGITVLSQKLLWPLWPKWLRAVWKTGRIIKKKEIDMLWIGQILPLGYIGLWFKKRKNIPFVVFCHGLDVLTPQTSKWKKRWLVKILREAKLVVVNSEFTKEEIKKMEIREKKVIVIYPCGGEITKYETHNKKREGEKVILSVGRLIKRKGFDKIIEIIPKILKRAANVKYKIIGNGPELENLKLQILKYNLQNEVSILENVSDEELASWYASCDVFTLPCAQIGPDVEGFGMVFLEAAKFSKPVVVGNSGGAPEAVHNGYGGYVVNPNSGDEIYQALLKLLTDEKFAKRMGEYGKEWVRKNFEWGREVKKLKEKLCQIP